MYEARYGDAWMFEVAEKYVAFCKQKGLHPVSTAIAWVGAHPAVTAPIIGARNVDQLKDSLAAVKIDMTPALRAEIADLSRTPPPATDRLGRAEGRRRPRRSSHLVAKDRRGPRCGTRFGTPEPLHPTFGRCRRKAARSAGESM